MNIKKLFTLAIIFAVLLSFGQLDLARGTGGDPPSGDPGTITVHKFHDRNGNGVQDEGEEDLEGWPIRIYRWDTTGLYIVAEAETGPDGLVTFSSLVPTRYKVWEQKQECWEPTTPAGMNFWDGGYYTPKWLASGQSITVEFGNIYICPPPPGTGTPGYWKNHPEAWPVEIITIGGVEYSKAEAIAHMNTPEEGDKTFTMFRALVAAKLNVLIGNDDSCIAATIAAADAWLAAYGPVGSGVAGSSEAWEEGEPLYEKLDAYNNGELCAPSRDVFEE